MASIDANGPLTGKDIALLVLFDASEICVRVCLLMNLSVTPS